MFTRHAFTKKKVKLSCYRQNRPTDLQQFGVACDCGGSYWTQSGSGSYFNLTAFEVRSRLGVGGRGNPVLERAAGAPVLWATSESKLRPRPQRSDIRHGKNGPILDDTLISVPPFSLCTMDNTYVSFMTISRFVDLSHPTFPGSVPFSSV